MNEEVSNKTVNLAISTTKLSVTMLGRALIEYARRTDNRLKEISREKQVYTYKGKQTLKQLMESMIIKVLLQIFSILIFVIVNARMIEIYLTVCLAPIPFATFGNKEQSQMGQYYLRSLFALGFQGFLIMVCVGIYAVLIQSVSFSGDITASLWSVMGYTVLLCFTLFKTGSIAKSVLHAQ